MIQVFSVAIMNRFAGPTGPLQEHLGADYWNDIKKLERTNDYR